MQTSVGFSQICKNDSKVPEALQRNASGTFFDISQVVIDTLQRIRTMNNDVSSYANDYWDIGALKGLADRHRISVLLIHHLWKLNDGAPMNMVSGTTGLSGATDSSFVLRKSNGDRLICLRRADGVDDPLQRASPSTLWRPPQPLCGTFPSDRAVVFSVPSRKATIGPQTARKRGKRRGTQVFAAHCMTTGDLAENKHCLWLFTPAHRRPRTAFGISLRAEALHLLQVARTSAEVRKNASGSATSKGDQSPFENSPALRGRRKDLRQEVTL